MLYADEKLYRHMHAHLSTIYRNADKSRKRTIFWGIIAAIGWSTILSNVPPPQKSRTIYPHLGLLVAAGSISATVKKNYEQATKAQKESLDLIKKLRCAQKHEDIRAIRKETQTLSQRYNRYLEDYFCRSKI